MRDYLLASLVTARRSRPQIPEPDRLGEVKPSESAHLVKDQNLYRPVNGMYPLLDLITEQGSSGLGNFCSLYSIMPTLIVLKSTKLSLLNNLFKNLSTSSLLVLIPPSQKSTSK